MGPCQMVDTTQEMASGRNEEEDCYDFEECDTVDDNFWTFEEIAFSCQKCTFVGGSKKDLKSHLSDKHPIHEKEPSESLTPARGSPEKEYSGWNSHDDSEINKRDLSDEDSANLRCKECPFRGKTQGGLTYHVWVKHQKEKSKKGSQDTRNVRMTDGAQNNFKCNTCGIVFLEKSELDLHKKSHINTQEKIYRCILCGFQAGSLLYLRKHSRSAHPEEKVENKCKECGFEGENLDEIENHLRDRHKDLMKQNTGSHERHKNDHAHNRNYRKHKCPDCNFDATRGERSLRKHVKDFHANHPNKCDKCSYSCKTKRGIGQHMFMHRRYEENKDIQFNCNKCDKSFKCEGSLNLHLSLLHKHERRSAIYRQHKCSDCNFVSIGKKRALIKHVLDAHGKVLKIYRKMSKVRFGRGRKKEDVNCPQCNFQSISDKKMRIHKKKAHGASFEFVCDSCGKDFNLKCLLLYHQKVHDTSRPKPPKDHKCSLCTFETSTKQKVRSHQQRAHKGVIVDMKCQHCQFEAVKLDKLETHLRDFHGNDASLVSCEKCKFSAFHGPTMEAHMNVHKLKCELCNYEAKTIGGLRNHISQSHLKKNPKRI